MTPQIADLVNSNAVTYRQPNFSYRLNDKSIIGSVNGMEAVRQAARHILMTERYDHAIYDDDYGIELRQYVGKDIGFIRAGIETTLREALTQDDRITDVYVNSVTKADSNDACNVDFTVVTIYGNYNENLEVGT